MQAQWPLIIFTLFVCLSAGTFASLGVACIKNKGLKVQLPALITSAALLVIGGVAVFFHLQHWERFFNGFAHISSGITQELIACVVIGIAMVAYFVAIRRSETGMPHKAFGWIAIAASVILVITMAHSYNMASLPVWNTVLLLVYYLGSAAVLGSCTYALIAAIVNKDDSGYALKFALYGSLAAIVTTLLFAISIGTAGSQFFNVAYYVDPTEMTTGMVSTTSISLFSTDSLLYYWLGGLVLGAAVPALVMFLASKKEMKPALLSAVAVIVAIAGGIMFRILLYMFGFSVFPLY